MNQLPDFGTTTEPGSRFRFLLRGDCVSCLRNPVCGLHHIRASLTPRPGRAATYTPGATFRVEDDAPFWIFDVAVQNVWACHNSLLQTPLPETVCYEDSFESLKFPTTENDNLQLAKRSPQRASVVFSDRCAERERTKERGTTKAPLRPAIQLAKKPYHHMAADYWVSNVCSVDDATAENKFNSGLCPPEWCGGH